jgi:hypothetical protein
MDELSKARELLAKHYDSYMPSSGLGAEVREGVRDNMPEMTALTTLQAERDALREALDKVRIIAKRGTMGPGPSGAPSDFEFIVELIDEALATSDLAED